MMFVSDFKRGLLVTNVKANATALILLPSIIESRFIIQKKRSVSLADIDGLLVHDLPPLQRLRFERLGLMRRTK